MWRPLGWSWRDINQQKSTIAEVPEVQEFKEREEWQELVNDAAAGVTAARTAADRTPVSLVHVSIRQHTRRIELLCL